jgi:UDP-N-acetylglucosamine/UDP-N-acetylgalactosamine diphosphorylase
MAADLPTTRDTLQSHGQEHLLRFYDTLDASAQQAMLDQLAMIDFEHTDELIESYVLNEPETDIPADLAPPTIYPATPTPELADRYAQAYQTGETMIGKGKVAAFVVAGGQGTRLGYEGPKGCYECTPVAKKPLFQVFAEQILAAQNRTGGIIPWYIMTSPINDVATRAFFRHHNYFGLDADNVMFFAQGTMPAIDFDGKLLLSKPGRVAENPNGHGGSLLSLAQSGSLADMNQRGVETISYFQVDNPLVRCVDPLFIGLAAMDNAEMSAKALPKRDPMEKLGNFCVHDGRVTVIEYSDMPDELARQCEPDGRLTFSAGSIAIHLLDRAFVERLTAGGRPQLPFHRAEKKVPFVDDEGTLVKPDTPNAVKLEMFVFDAMPLASRCVILETVRSEEFSPIKNAEGLDSPATCLHDLVRRAGDWLKRAGATLPRDAAGEIAAAIEISPLLADSADALVGVIDPETLTIEPGQNLYLAPASPNG